MGNTASQMTVPHGPESSPKRRQRAGRLPSLCLELPARTATNSWRAAEQTAQSQHPLAMESPPTTYNHLGDRGLPLTTRPEQEQRRALWRSQGDEQGHNRKGKRQSRGLRRLRS